MKPKMKPKMIMMIRHGEKTVNGTDLHVDLSPAGQVRANELPNFFMKHMPSDLKLPDVLVAMKQKSPKDSDRPVETITPLATALDLPIHADFTQEEHLQVANKIETLGDNRTVLLCWEHCNLVSIAQILGAPVTYWGLDPSTDASNNGDCFDAIWVLSRDEAHRHKFRIYREFDVLPPNNLIDYTNALPTPVFSVDLD